MAVRIDLRREADARRHDGVVVAFGFGADPGDLLKSLAAVGSAGAEDAAFLLIGFGSGEEERHVVLAVDEVVGAGSDARGAEVGDDEGSLPDVAFVVGDVEARGSVWMLAMRAVRAKPGLVKSKPPGLATGSLPPGISGDAGLLQAIRGFQGVRMLDLPGFAAVEGAGEDVLSGLRIVDGVFALGGAVGVKPAGFEADEEFIAPGPLP